MNYFCGEAFLSLAMLTVALQGCGGGSGASDANSNVFSQPHRVATDAGPLAAIMVPTPRQAAARTPDASSFLNWAESAYPNYFPPAQSNKTLDVWTYRYYPQTDIYLGTNTSGDVLGLLGKGNGAYDSIPLGKIGDFGCSVYPSDCAVVSTLADLGGPTGVVGNNTLCLNADLTSKVPLYTRIESVLGPNSIESPSDSIYTPPLPHIAERADGVGGAYLVFSAIEPTDINTSQPQDRSRTEIKLAPSTSGPHTAFQAHEGDVFVYSCSESRLKVARLAISGFSDSDYLQLTSRSDSH